MTTRANPTKILIVAFLIFLILYLLYKNDLNENINASISNHSLILQSKKEPKSLNKLQKTSIPEEQLYLARNKIQSSYKLNTYMDLYEKNILASDCRIVFKSEMDLDKKTDPYTFLSRNISYKSVGRQKEVSKAQIQAMSDFLEQCKTLEHEVQALIDKNHYSQKYKWSHPIISYSFKRLHEAKPETDEELAIVDVQNKLSEFGKLSMSYGAYVNGKSTLSKEDRKQINDEINELQQLMYPNLNQQAYPRENFIKAKERREKLQQEIDRKYQYLKDAMYIDEKRLQRYREQYAFLYPYVVKLLKTEFAYVFIQVMQKVSIGSARHGKAADNKNKKFILKFYPEYKTLDDMIYEGTGFRYRPYFDKIITPAKTLYLCNLGFDCSEQSRTIRNYCLGLNDYPIYKEACSTDLETFYYGTYLSTNQKNDVEKILNFMVSEYAQ